MPQLKYALEAFKDGYEHLAKTTRADLVLTLLEAARLSQMKWKRFVLLVVKLAINDFDDHYLRCRLAEIESIVYRINGDIHHATSCLKLSHDNIGSTKDSRMHAAIGRNLIQNSLNCIQVEDLLTARKILEDWRPLSQNASLMETAVVFRKGIILGRALRLHGDFQQSLTHLQASQSITEQNKNHAYDEDLRDLTCELSETLLELNNPMSAKRYLRLEMARRLQYPDSTLGGSLLELCLAESLFLQSRFEEAEKLCVGIQSRSGFLKAERLRLHIILAKLRHVKGDYKGASCHWGKVMAIIRRFPNETCATQIIVQSVYDILGRLDVSGLDKKALLHQSLETLLSLRKLAKPGGYRCWIAGIRHWVAYLQSDRSSIRSHI